MADKEYEMMPSSLETIDRAFYRWLNETLNISATTNEGWKKVPLIWVSAERSFQVKHDKDLRILSYKILLEKFNSKYGTTLQAPQKRLLKEYIENISNSNSIKKFVGNEIDKLINSINMIKPRVDDKIVRIKLAEVNHQLDKIKDAKTVNETHILSCMRSYSLIKELKNVIK